MVGNTGNAIPFGRSSTSNQPVRYQQLYDASEFIEVGEVITISEIRFRIDDGAPERRPTSFDPIELRFSTTSVANDDLTPVIDYFLDQENDTDDSVSRVVELRELGTRTPLFSRISAGLITQFVCTVPKRAEPARRSPRCSRSRVCAARRARDRRARLSGLRRPACASP